MNASEWVSELNKFAQGADDDDRLGLTGAEATELAGLLTPAPEGGNGDAGTNS